MFSDILAYFLPFLMYYFNKVAKHERNVVATSFLFPLEVADYPLPCSINFFPYPHPNMCQFTYFYSATPIKIVSPR